MKHIKRTLALLLAVVLVLALSISAFAVDTNGSIKVDNAVVNKTYTLYRIFDLDSHNTDYSAINYKVSAKWANFFVTGAAGLNYVTIDDMGYVTWKDGANAADFAAAAIAYAKANGIANDGQQKATGSIVEFTNLPLGYYLVQSDLGALCSLDTTMPNVTIKEKNGKPTVDKEVEENGVYGKTNDANIGDTVNFKTTITVTDGNPVAYILHDKMSAGLTFDPASVTVKVNGETFAAANYDLVTSGLTDGCTFELRFHDVGNASVLKPNDVVTVEYSATVNNQAVIASTGNPNDTWLDYDNTHSTEKSTTRTYVWEMKVIKFTKKNNEEVNLKDAQFVLYRLNGTTKKYVVANSSNKVTGWTENTYDSNLTSKATVFTTPENGTFTISGLDTGTYYLEEIKAPAGYNMLKEPIKIVITASIDQTTGAGTATVTYNKTSTGDVKVENQTGTELPSTGGIGTTIFYIVGSLLAVGAVILLVTKKRMGKTEG